MADMAPIGDLNPHPLTDEETSKYSVHSVGRSRSASSRYSPAKSTIVLESNGKPVKIIVAGFIVKERQWAYNVPGRFNTTPLPYHSITLGHSCISTDVASLRLQSQIIGSLLANIHLLRAFQRIFAKDNVERGAKFMDGDSGHARMMGNISLPINNYYAPQGSAYHTIMATIKLSDGKMIDSNGNPIPPCKVFKDRKEIPISDVPSICKEICNGEDAYIVTAECTVSLYAGMYMPLYTSEVTFTNVKNL